MTETTEGIVIGVCILIGVASTLVAGMIIKDTELGCEFGWHVPIAEVDIVYWHPNKDIVLSYWVRCERCGHFLSGLTSDHHTLEELLS